MSLNIIDMFIIQISCQELLNPTNQLYHAMAVRQQSDTHSIVSSVNGTDDREARSKFWIAAYTRPKSEKKAASELGKFVTIYVPTQTIIKQWSDRKKKIESVVIPMVIFAEVSSDEEILTVKKHPLVLKVLTLPGQKQAAHIPTIQIERLKFMIEYSEESIDFTPHDFSMGDKVTICRGNLKGLMGTLKVDSNGRTKVGITIDFLGCATIEISTTDIKLIN